jgi:hypothetical protein
MRPSLLLLSLVALGCGSSAVPDIEDRVTITQGIYGQLIGGCDTTGCVERPLDYGDVAAFAEPVPSGPVTLTAVAQTTVDDAGFFELTLPPGTHYLAWITDGAVHTSTTRIVVPTGRARWDFTSGPGGGIWQER